MHQLDLCWAGRERAEVLDDEDEGLPLFSEELLYEAKLLVFELHLKQLALLLIVKVQDGLL